MASSPPHGSLEFLRGNPAPVDPASSPHEDRADRLPADVVDRLMRLPGVDGVWVERQPDGSRVVVLHHTPAGPAAHLPSTVNGLPTRIVGGEPIRAYRAV
jgi:hypothetical protein